MRADTQMFYARPTQHSFITELISTRHKPGAGAAISLSGPHLDNSPTG